MADSINEVLNAAWAGEQIKQRTLRYILRKFGMDRSSACLNSAGLVIKAGGSALAKAGSAFYAMAGNVLVTKTANTDMAALVGTVTNAKFNAYVFYIDSAGTLTSAMGTEGAALKNIVFPLTPENKAAIGFVVVNPTGTGNFVGGTTALDDATVAPNAAYVSLTDAFNPNQFSQLMAGN